METNAERVRAAFSHWERGSSREFFELVSPTVTWRVIGTTPISGTFTDKASFVAGATGKLIAQLGEPLLATIVAVHDVGDTVILQWEGRSRGRNGRPYEQTYCWVLGFEAGLIRNVIAYLDTALVEDMFAD